MNISIAWAVLHNFHIKVGDEWEDDFYDYDDDHGNKQNNDFMQDGKDIRERVQISASGHTDADQLGTDCFRFR